MPVISNVRRHQVTESPDIKAKDRILRVAEGLVLAPLKFGFCGIAIARFLKPDIADPAFWLAVLGFCGLISLWWLIVSVKASTSVAIRIPVLVWLGIVAGMLCVTGFLVLFSRPQSHQPEWPTYAIWLVPVFILGDRLACVWKSRKLRFPEGGNAV